MKNLFKKALKITIICSLLVFSSCEKDLYEQNIRNSSRNIILRNVSLKNDTNKSNTNLLESVNLLKNEVLNTSSRMVHDSIRDFYYDDEKGLYIQDGNKNSYTFPIFRTSSDNKIENLLFNLNAKGKYDVYLVKYDLAKDQLANLTKEQFAQIPVKYTSLILDGRVTVQLICIEFQSFLLVGNSSWTTSDPGYHYEWVTTSTECTWVTGGSPDGIGGAGNPPNPNQDAGNNGGASDTIITVPIAIDLDISQLGLSSQQLNWYNNHPEAHESIVEATSSQNNAAAIQILNSMMNNDGYSGDGYQGDNDDENSDYNGLEELIPTIITLNDGSTVSVTFGTTESDGLSANNPVATSVVDAIKHALNDANSNLPASDKITSIYIMATTNGSHAPTSNHTRGTAVDISRINGKKILSLGSNNQVQSLQNGFESYNNIRENFGPTFKHKTYPNGTTNNNWPVGGHHDHIHISVQNN